VHARKWCAIFRVNLPGSFEIGRKLFQRRVRSIYTAAIAVRGDVGGRTGG